MEQLNNMLYDAITNFTDIYGCHRFNDEENHNAYMKVVDMCITFGKIPEPNRNKFSTHGRLESAIIYDSNRERFCGE